ncbi:MAG: hypothetical protein FJ398_00205 [Verrucomicrobia bacterium]|nr:hypothetical protein [Verrucomicrobiota bacterium]
MLDAQGADGGIHRVLHQQQGIDSRQGDLAELGDSRLQPGQDEKLFLRLFAFRDVAVIGDELRWLFDRVFPNFRCRCFYIQGNRDRLVKEQSLGVIRQSAQASKSLCLTLRIWLCNVSLCGPWKPF